MRGFVDTNDLMLRMRQRQMNRALRGAAKGIENQRSIIAPVCGSIKGPLIMRHHGLAEGVFQVTFDRGFQRTVAAGLAAGDRTGISH